jgi:hypothetical protein
MQTLRISTARLFRGWTSQKPLISRGFHKDFNPSLEDQTFKLSDKRTMGFAEYGDLTGTPAFFFHGAPWFTLRRCNIQHHSKETQYPHNLSRSSGSRSFYFPALPQIQRLPQRHLTASATPRNQTIPRSRNFWWRSICHRMRP